ncbi:unnamed protein product [Oikopleura dioica]|uniref:Uncharacterized protein n=1 Tax=Oikopleura dioica TaxID=34765 RepID=E4YCK3_OIKDI|nr:unnamed protein product [Oikopleura dioica]
MSAPYPTQGSSGANSYGINQSDMPPMAGGSYTPPQASVPPAQNPHFSPYPQAGPPQNSGYPSYPPNQQNQGHFNYPNGPPQHYQPHQPNQSGYHQSPHFHHQQHEHHGNYAAHGYPPQETKDKKKKKGLLGQVEGLVSGVIGGGSNSHGSHHDYQQQPHYSQQNYGHPQKQKKSMLDSGKEMAMFALEAKMMHGGMGKKMKYDAKRQMFNAVTKGFK